MMNLPKLGQMITFASQTNLQNYAFAAGETAMVTNGNDAYILAQTNDGREIQTWCATFKEFRTHARRDGQANVPLCGFAEKAPTLKPTANDRVQCYECRVILAKAAR